MERFKHFIGKDVNFKKLSNFKIFEQYGIKCQSLPDTIVLKSLKK
ncbi:hypothetical protein [Thermodesulfovibrio hydrogeniphilus]